jgi:hypothetical protein
VNVRVLTIGNSLAQDALRYLEEMTASAGGGRRFLFGRANLGGCSLEKHWNLVEQCDRLPRVQPYNFQFTGREPRAFSLRAVLAAERWDLVTLQQVSGDSWRPETYQPWLDRLAALVRQTAPTAAVALHQTWAYRSDGPSLAAFGLDQARMFSRLEDAYRDAAARLNCRLIPCGLAFQKARAMLPYRPDRNFDFARPILLELPDQANSLVVGYYWSTGNTPSGRAELCLDERHGNARGAYLAGAVWHACLTGLPAEDNRFRPPELEPGEAGALRRIAWQAVAESGGALSLAGS